VLTAAEPCRLIAPSSRPPRTGSIAATTRRPTGSSRQSRRPVRQGRAPLRQRPGGRRHQHPPASSRPPRTGSIAAVAATVIFALASGVVPSAKDGLHCGWTWAAFRPATGLVVPSAKDGLHCGFLPVPPGPVPGIWSSRPPRTGSIAAEVTAWPPDWDLTGRPVRQGRAPLRPGGG